MVLGLPPIGCLPVQMTFARQKQNERRCIDKQNSDSQEYNEKLKKSLTDIQSNLTGSVIFYADIYAAILDMATNPQSYGNVTLSSFTTCTLRFAINQALLAFCSVFFFFLLNAFC